MRGGVHEETTVYKLYVANKNMLRSAKEMLMLGFDFPVNAQFFAPVYIYRSSESCRPHRTAKSTESTVYDLPYT